MFKFAHWNPPKGCSAASELEGPVKGQQDQTDQPRARVEAAVMETSGRCERPHRQVFITKEKSVINQKDSEGHWAGFQAPARGW